MTINNVTSTFITFDASTRVVSIETSDNMFGDSTFAVTITGTHVGGSASLTFNVGTIKDCSGVQLEKTSAFTSTSHEYIVTDSIYTMDLPAINFLPTAPTGS